MADSNSTLLLTANKDITRFLSKVIIPDDSNACWEWIAGTNRQGYGKFCAMARPRKQITFIAHRWFFQQIHGVTLPRKILVRHSCDNPPCCNPAHLLTGSYADNAQDAVTRDRLPKGDTHWSKQQPERILRGENHPHYKNPRAADGLARWRTEHPELIPRGDRSPAKLHPERMARGERQHLAKLTAEKILEIRQWHEETGIGAYRLARYYGVSKPTIQKVLSRKTWTHI